MTRTDRRRWLVGIAGALLAVLVAAFALAYREADRDSRLSIVHVAEAGAVRHLLGPSDFPPGMISGDFGVANANTVAVLVDGRLHVAEALGAAGARVREIDVQGAQPGSFALDAQGELLAISNGFFGALDAKGRIGEAVPLPDTDMRLAPSARAGAVYLFGGAGGEWRLYRFLADGSLQIVMQSDQQIVAVADAGEEIYVATTRAILRIRPVEPELLFAVPEGWTLRSLAVGADGQLFFATDAKVYGLIGPDAISIVNDAGGSLRVHDDVLYVLDPRRRLLFDLRPANTQLFRELTP